MINIMTCCYLSTYGWLPFYQHW